VRDEKGVVPIARYGPSTGWLDDQLAITVHGVKGGLVYYVGAYLDDAAQQAFLDRLVGTAMMKPVMEVPTGVEVRKRVNAEKEEIFIVINHEREEKRVPLPWPAREHLSGEAGKGELILAPYGAAILTKVTDKQA
jgi:beta-galactosidase GanA